VNDVLSNVSLKVGDRVRFSLVQDSNTGTIYACHIQLTESVASSAAVAMKTSSKTPTPSPSPPQGPPRLYRGVISVLRDTFGKIEREDAYKETFFHFADYKDTSQLPRIGLNVEFEVESRLGKEIASNIRALPPGTVDFDELSQQFFVGRITKASLPNNNSTGHLIYESEGKVNKPKNKLRKRKI
jgi:cold shock CspA family protein